MALFVLLIITLGMVLINLLSEDNNSVQISAEYLSPSLKKNRELPKNKTWTQELAKSKETKFTFPVNELFMQIDLKSYVPPKVKSFRLVVNRADRYSLFCIVQTLSSMNLPYVVDKKNKTPEIYVSSKTENSLKKVVKRLEDYDIKSKIIEVWL
ncbi:hypothetical protein [Sulfurospirillum arcachonense]|uniref:hypothetical protein n=1 Tax=Sulfurospirillum arcachonense TaxID=57666 RepID=UPI001FE00799|nr:hypothetical protein [Sulfurospirillum arcachonense]